MADKILPKTKHDLSSTFTSHQPNPVIQDGVLRVTCCQCGERFSKPLTPKEKLDVIAMYQNNGVHPDGLVQTVFPSWTNEERELFLLSHMCDKCWNLCMSNEGEEE